VCAGKLVRLGTQPGCQVLELVEGRVDAADIARLAAIAARVVGAARSAGIVCAEGD
jgi:hypothetical protein